MPLCVDAKSGTGNSQTTIAPVFDVTYVPLYGAFLITGLDGIRLDRIQSLQLVEETEAVQSFKVCSVGKKPSRQCSPRVRVYRNSTGFLGGSICCAPANSRR